MPRPVNRGDRSAETQAYIVLGIPVSRVNIDRLPFGLANQVAL